MTTYKEFHRRSISDPEGFWGEQARLIHWRKPFGKVLRRSIQAICEGRDPGPHHHRGRECAAAGARCNSE